MTTKLLIKEYNELVSEQLRRRHEIESERNKLVNLLEKLNSNINSYNRFDKSLEKFRDKLVGNNDTSVKYDYGYECMEYIIKNSEKMTTMERLNSGLIYDNEKKLQELLDINIQRAINRNDIIELAHTISYRIKYGDSSMMPDEYKQFNLLNFSI